jgi:hypothetical protein
MPQLLHAGLQAALDRLAERHPAGVRRAARILVSGTRSVFGGAARSGAPEGGLQMSRMLALACVLAAFALAAGSASAQQPSGTSIYVAETRSASDGRIAPMSPSGKYPALPTPVGDAYATQRGADARRPRGRQLRASLPIVTNSR